ncbi:MAG: hypothetical protein KGK07_13675 [Chloroflexota bacterium]|nr:hypothetical protein [Chloroflexota bacterium]
MGELNVTDAKEYTDEEMAHLGGAHVIVRAKPDQVRRKVMVGRLQRALGVTPVDGIYGPNTNRALCQHMNVDEGAALDDRLLALGTLKLPGEIETLIVQQWKTNDPTAHA